VLMYVLNVLAPIALIVVFGIGLRKGNFARPGFFREANRLVYWVGLPALLFQKTAGAQVELGVALRIFGVLLAGAGACLLLGFLLGRVLGFPRRSQASFMQGAYRGNLAYVGLPVILFSFAGLGDEGAREIEAIAVLAIAPLIPLYNVAAVLVLLWGRPAEARREGEGVGHIVFQVLTNPLLVACVAGLAWSLTGLGLPLILSRSLTVVGNLAMPLALLGIGASLTRRSVTGNLVGAAMASAIKLIAGPVVGYMLGRAIGLGPNELRIAMIYLACPTAIMSFVMAEQMGADSELSGSIVVLTTVLAFPVLALVLILTAG
ncbi:AEC family transporter, partial [bacterium]|nr:AEC family transporter [bacterium]